MAARRRRARRRLPRAVAELLLAFSLILAAARADAAGLAFLGATVEGAGAVDGLDAAVGLAVSPDNAYVYAAAQIEDAVAVLRRQAGTGMLTFVGAARDGVGGVDGLDGAVGVALSPDGTHVYAAAQGDDALAAFRREAVTGALTFVEAERDGVGGVDGLAGARSVAVSPDGAHVYVAGLFDGAVAVFRRDAVTGALAFVEVQKDGVGGVSGLASASSVTVSPDGLHVYATGFLSSALVAFARDPATGALTFLQALTDGVDGVDGLGGARAVALSGNGAHAYVAAQLEDAVSVFSRDAVSGLLTFVEVRRDGVGAVNGIAGAFAVTVSRDRRHVYVAGSTDDAVAVFSRSGVTGGLTFVTFAQDEVGPVKGLAGAAGVLVVSDGPELSPTLSNLYVAGPGDDAVAVFTRNPNNGTLVYREREKEVLGAADGLAGVDALAVSPDGLQLYAAGATEGTIGIYTRDPELGTLAFFELVQDGVAGVEGLAGAAGVVLAPGGDHLYAVGASDHALVAFDRTVTTGSLVPIDLHVDGVAGVDGLGGARAVAIDPDGEHVYVAAGGDGAVAVFDRDPGDGALTFVELQQDEVGGVQGLAGASAVALGPGGGEVYVTGADDDAVVTFTRDPLTGALTFVEALQDGVGGVVGLAGASGVAVSPDGGHVYVSGAVDGTLAVFARAAATGQLMFLEMHQDGVDGVTGLSGASGVVVAPDGSAVYASAASPGAVAVFGRDPFTGRLAFVEARRDGVAGDDGLGGAAAVTIGPDGRHVYVAGAVDQAIASFRVIACGDAVVDVDEDCDDGDTSAGDCCSPACRFEPAGSPCPDEGDICTADVCDGGGTCVHPDNDVCPRCGDGEVDPNEDCDDGNLVDGDCCSAACGFEPAGSPCADDGDACTAQECDGGGVCLDLPVVCPACQACDPALGCIAAPRTGCRRPTRGGATLLRLRNRALNPRDRLLWRWRNGEATSRADFGSPADDDDYALCIFGETEGLPVLFFGARAPAGGRCQGRPCWTGVTRYRDPARTPDGLTAITLRPGGPGRARITVKGAGENLRIPVLPAPLPLRVQLQGGGTACWEALHTPERVGRNTGTILRVGGE